MLKVYYYFFFYIEIASRFRRYQSSPFYFPQQRRLRILSKAIINSLSFFPSSPVEYLFFSVATIFFEELKFSTKTISRKKVRMKNDVDKGLMFAIIYVAGKTCCRILYLSCGTRNGTQRSRMVGHSDSNFDRLSEAPPIHIRSVPNLRSRTSGQCDVKSRGLLSVSKQTKIRF